MKPPDLSTRQNGIVKAPSSPVFSRRNANPTGTLIFAAAGSQPIFQAPGSVTVLWIQFQVQQSVTAQLYKNGEALSAAYQLNSGTVVRYAGLLLLGNETLSLSVNGACTVTFELAWVKEHDERLITTDTAIYNAGGTNDAPTGAEFAPVVRDILRKKTTIEYDSRVSGSAASNFAFTGNWHDSEQDGTVCVVGYVFANQIGNAAGNNFGIQESDDITNANFTRVAAGSGSNPSYPANILSRVYAVIKARYWRIVAQNGATLATTFQVTTCAFNMMIQPPALNNYAGDNASLVDQTPSMTTLINGTVGQAGDAFSNQVFQNLTAATTQFGNLLSYAMLCNGATWDRARNNVNTTTGDTGAKVATFNGATQTNFDAVGAYITVLLGAVTGTTPTLTMQLQWSPDGGTTWLNLGPASATLTTTSQTAVLGIYATNFSQTPGATPANLTTGANVSTFINAPLPRTWRIVYTIGGTTPSFTISSVQVNYIRG